MVTIENACDKAMQYCVCDFIKSVADSEKCYRILFGWNDEEPDIGISGIIVDKSTGTVSDYFPPDHIGEKFLPLMVPKKYARK